MTRKADAQDRPRDEASVPDPGDDGLIALLDALPIAASVATAADQAIVYGNAAWLSLLGFTSMDEARGRTIGSFLAPADLEKARAAIERGRETGHFTASDRRYQLVRADGSLVDVEIAGAPAVLAGEPAIVSLVSDVTAGEHARRAAVAAEAFARSILESVPIGMHFYRLDDDDRLVFTGANAAADKILGVDHGRLVGLGILEAFPSLEGTGIPETYVRLARDGDSWHEESVYYEDDRIASSFDVNAFQTGPGTMAAAFTDITERKRAEADLAAANALQSAIFQAMPDGFSMLDANGVHTSVNPALCAMTGFTEDELVGVGPPHPYWPPEEYDEIRHAFEATLQGEASEFEFTFMRKGGERFPVLVTPAVIRDRKGALVSAFAIVRDVTDRVAAERALRESEERYRSVVSTIHEGVMLQAADGTILTCNRTAAELFRIGEGEATGQTSVSRDWGVVDERGEPLAGGDHPSMVTLRTGKSCENVVLGVRDARGTRWIDVNTEPIFEAGSGTPAYVVISFTEITRRRAAEEALRDYKEGLERAVAERTRDLTEANAALEVASRAKSQFLASMSHELRTPLNSIIGFTGIMLQGLTGELTSEQRAQLEMVNRAGRQLLGLVSDVLDLERIEAGRVEVAFEEVDVAKLASALADTVGPMAADMGLTMELDAQRAPATVRTDKAKVEQILLNFLSNAVKYTETGGIALEIEQRGDGTIAFSVRDTGIGIAPEDRTSIFEEFRQLPAHRGAKHPGSGLGLSISQQLAELIGGRVELESDLGVGSTFTLVLPAG